MSLKFERTLEAGLPSGVDHAPAQRRWHLAGGACAQARLRTGHLTRSSSFGRDRALAPPARPEATAFIVCTPPTLDLRGGNRKSQLSCRQPSS